MIRLGVNCLVQVTTFICMYIYTLLIKTSQVFIREVTWYFLLYRNENYAHQENPALMNR